MIVAGGRSLFLFSKLLLAHLLADFVLQFDELYELKNRRLAGYLIHVGILVFLTAVVSLPYWVYPSMWGMIAVIGISHLLEDLLKNRLQTRYSHHCFALYAADQAVHILILGGVLLLPFGRETRELNVAGWLDPFYNNQDYTTILIFLIVVSFAGTYTLYNFRRNFIPNTRSDHYLTNFEMVHAMIERFFVAGIFLFNPGVVFILFSPAIGLLRIFSRRLRSPLDFGLSYAWAAAFALLLVYLTLGVKSGLDT